MTIAEEENREILEGINFGDGEEMPEEAPAAAVDAPESAEVAPEPAPEPDAVSEAQEKAATIGWRPKEQWKGDPDKWVDAETFLKKGEEILPIMKADRERLFGEVKDLRKQVDDVLKYHKEDRERIQKRMREDHEQEIAKLKAQQRAAVEEGDTEAFDRIEAEKERLEATKPAETPPGAAEGTQPPPEFDKAGFDAWQKENKWYQVGGQSGYAPQNDITRAAQAMAYRVQADNPHLSGWSREFMDKVTDAVKLAYPDKFTNVRREGAAGVEGASPTGAVPRKKTYNDLPPDAKKVCRDMMKVGMKESEYIAEYFGEEGITLEDG